MEGGANVLSEAIAADLPVRASNIAGNVGILGRDYSGLFRVGDTSEVAFLMVRAEADRRFVSKLRDRITRLAPLFDPKREQDAWSTLLAEY